MSDVEHTDNTTDYVNEEVEYSDVGADEEHGEGGPAGEDPADDSPEPEALATPEKKVRKKVRPSSAVQSAPMESPSSMKKKAQRLGDKNPFPSTGRWTAEMFAQITVRFPHLNSKNETTNELTRTNRPEGRYWRAPITFAYRAYTSETLRFDNVSVPFHTGKNYGSSYVYLSLPSFVGRDFADAGKSLAPTRTSEASLMPDNNNWWKIANDVEHKFGVINNETRKFHPKSLETIFSNTQSGIRCNVVLKFNCKCSTDDKEPLKQTTMRTVSVEVVRAYIEEVDVNVPMPIRVLHSVKKEVAPAAIQEDVANDALMKRLADLGL